ncbi:MAG TPA: LPS assembly protein LptD [Oligoflexia bacterium]|nr:LPS assembly protein LptD [Oligoflexia bacterium]HMP49160.1 LPS assembly protein LptD [Oligoflexia bacterium]
MKFNNDSDSSKLEESPSGCNCLINYIFPSPLSYFIALVLINISFHLSFLNVSEAQVLPPDRRFLFLDDQLKKERAIERKREFKQKRARASASKAVTGVNLPFDIAADVIEFDTSGSVMEAIGNVIIAYSTLVAESSEARVDTVKNEAELSDDVRISDVNTNLTASSAKLNLDSGEGILKDVSLYFAEGDYRVNASEVTRSANDEFSLKDTLLTTCICPDGDDCPPWSMFAGRAKIQRDGYGQAWGSTIRLYNLPVMYVPYIFFPAKTERQSGFLPATFGVGRRSGLTVTTPFYWDINNSTDMTISGIYEAKIRTGADVEFRKMFAREHSLEMGGLYFDESQRGGRLLGTRIDGLADPSLDSRRYAGFINENWSTKIIEQPLQLIIDGRYVSDDLLPREFEQDRIARTEDRFVTSTAVIRTPIGDSYSLDLSSEFNQAMVTNDDFVFQRLPELTFSGLDYFRPFGDNPFGLRAVFTHNLGATNFVRKEDYSGSRLEMHEQMKLPFFIGNYLDGSIQAGIRATKYELSQSDTFETEMSGEGLIDDFMADPEDPLDPSSTQPTGAESEPPREPLPNSSDRFIPSVDTRLGTAFEKVYGLDDSSIFKFIGELGKSGRSQELVRMKHTIEPSLRHLYIPDVDQTRNPQFDSRDRLAQRNVVTYALTQRFFGRYEPRNAYVYGIEEAAPRIDDMSGLTASGPLDETVQFGVDPDSSTDYASLRRGEVQEVVTFRLSQSYNLLDNPPNSDRSTSFSDVAADVAVFPNEYFKLRTRTDFNTEQSSFSSYLIEGQLSNNRGDLIRSRLRFVENSIRQLESGIEFGLTDRIRLGYYSRYDDVVKDFIEQRAGVRLTSSCNCWMMDVLVADQTNPDDTRISFNLTLLGLGELGNTFFTNVSGRNERVPGQ